MELASESFSDGGDIPLRFTGLGEDVSPELHWTGVPGGTKSLAVIADDPDAPMGTWVHWVIYDIPKSYAKIKEGFPKEKIDPAGIKQGKNSFGKIGYKGPYPPPGPPHRYIFTLYALDIDPEIEPDTDKNGLMKQIEGHILDKAELSGKFGR